MFIVHEPEIVQAPEERHVKSCFAPLELGIGLCVTFYKYFVPNGTSNHLVR